MCGILGGTIRSWDYQKGIESIKHRGPDGGRIESVDGITLAFVRLAVQDLTAAGMQPMQSGDGQVFLVFNGEIYGYETVREELKKKYVFHGNSDTEVILNAYLEWGNSFIEKIDGMFAIAIYDRRSREIKLFRDRTGIKPLYYYIGEEGIAFASELKALENAGRDIHWKIDETAIYDFLFYQYIPDPKTMYRQVKKLKPGYKLTYHLDTRRTDIDRYWRLKVNTTTGRKRKREDIAEELRYLIGKSVRNHLIADVPTGTFLSGGIDSSIITYEAAQAAPKIHAFSIGFTEKEFDESEIAERFCLEKNIMLKKKILQVKDIAKIRDRMRGWYDEPFADTSAYPTFLVSEFARKDATVVLTGDGGDELFGGYGRYLSFLDFYKKRKESGHKAKPFIQSKKRRNDELAAIRRGLGMTEREFYWEYERKWKIRRDYDPYDHLRQYDMPELPPFTRMRYLDFKTYLPGDILTKVDRVSMAVSLEARVPFLSREVVEFAFSLSEEECNHGEGLKACLKDAYDGIIPNEILYGIKKGFGIPTNYLWREKKAVSLYAGVLEEHWKEL